jgi:hypothetical protein
MSDYNYTTNKFGSKDALASGNSLKKIKGSEFETEFLAIESAISTKADTASPTFTGTISAGDDVKIQMGAGNDLEIYHDSAGNNSVIADVGTGALQLRGSAVRLLNSDGTETLGRFTQNAAVELFYDNGKKFETTSAGATITGDFTVEHSDNGDETFILVHNTGIGDADALLRLDSSDTGESVVEFLHDGTQGASIEWFTDGNPDLNIRTASGTAAAVIDMQPNDTRVARFKDDLITLSTQATSNISANGTAMEFQVGGSSCGKIYASSVSPASTITIGVSNTGLKFLQTGGAYSISPASVENGSVTDDLVDLGTLGARFDDIYATNGTIQTSDRNDKQDIAELTDAEERVAVACKGLIRKFKWRNSVEENGDDARYHFGVIAQDVQAAFAAEGLDAGDYGLFISSTWTDDNGVEQTRLGVRYSELLAFIIGGL